MYQCNYYWLFAPLRGGFKDTPERVAAFDLDIAATEQKIHKLHLFCDDEGLPHFARLTIGGLMNEVIPEDSLPLLQTVKEHLLSVLRLTYKPEIALAEPGIVYSFTAEGQHPQTQMLIEEVGRDHFDPAATKNLLSHTFPMREYFRLYMDGEDKRIPLQYRFLSFYKLLELRYRKSGFWMHQDINRLLDSFDNYFKRLGYTKAPLSILHDLRDRCAHIKTGRDVLGVTHLNHKAAASVNDLLPIMRAICAVILNERADGKFALKTEVVTEQYSVRRESQRDDAQQ